MSYAMLPNSSHGSHHLAGLAQNRHSPIQLAKLREFMSGFLSYDTTRLPFLSQEQYMSVTRRLSAIATASSMRELSEQEAADIELIVTSIANERQQYNLRHGIKPPAQVLAVSSDNTQGLAGGNLGTARTLEVAHSGSPQSRQATSKGTIGSQAGLSAGRALGAQGASPSVRPSVPPIRPQGGHDATSPSPGSQPRRPVAQDALVALGQTWSKSRSFGALPSCRAVLRSAITQNEDFPFGDGQRRPLIGTLSSEDWQRLWPELDVLRRVELLEVRNADEASLVRSMPSTAEPGLKLLISPSEHLLAALGARVGLPEATRSPLMCDASMLPGLWVHLRGNQCDDVNYQIVLMPTKQAEDAASMSDTDTHPVSAAEEKADPLAMETRAVFLDLMKMGIRRMQVRDFRRSGQDGAAAAGTMRTNLQALGCLYGEVSRALLTVAWEVARTTSKRSWALGGPSGGHASESEMTPADRGDYARMAGARAAVWTKALEVERARSQQLGKNLEAEIASAIRGVGIPDHAAA